MIVVGNMNEKLNAMVLNCLPLYIHFKGFGVLIQDIINMVHELISHP